MLMVISPAKKLDGDTPAPIGSETTTPQYLAQAESLIGLLRGMDSFAIAELMRLSMNLADLNAARYAAWRADGGGKQALWIFRGDVYRSMDADSFSSEDVAFCQRHLRILSGLYGLLRPLDAIYPYRLEMGTRLANPAGANLYAFWGDTITRGLNTALEESGSRYLINLASNEYFKAVRPDLLAGEVITPVFKERKNGGYKVIGIHAKRARGMMARSIIRNRLRHPDALRAFDGGGYRWNPTLSEGARMVFTR